MTLWTSPCFSLKELGKEEEQIGHSFYAHLKLNALPEIMKFQVTEWAPGPGRLPHRSECHYSELSIKSRTKPLFHAEPLPAHGFRALWSKRIKIGVEKGSRSFSFTCSTCASRAAGPVNRTRLPLLTGPKKTGFSTKACGFTAIRISTARSFSHSLAWGLRRDDGPAVPETQEGRQAAAIGSGGR